MKRFSYVFMSVILCISMIHMPVYATEIDTGEENSVVIENNEDEYDDAAGDLHDENSFQNVGETLYAGETQKENVGQQEMSNGSEVVESEPEIRHFSGDEAIDNDKCFEEYVNRAFGITNEEDQPGLRKRGTKSAPVLRRDNLSDLNKVLYDLLKEEIEKVANGSRTSTEFVFSAEQLGIQVEFTREELGVDILAGGDFTDEALAKFDELSGLSELNASYVVDALVADCPYDMYWFDKTITGGYSYGPGSGITGSSNYMKMVDPESAYTVSMSISSDYGTGYTMSDLPARVNLAVQNAQDIVAEYAGYADYNKLVSYKDEICDLTSYNRAAANDGSTAYGDPWQLIYVFDGDSSTNVVCEGYSKAFKYLCDKSSFTGDIACYQVTGYMRGGTGAGGHMWNIVKMDDGKYYLVDVTNCDEGSVGYSEKLFLKGYSNTTYDENVGDGYKFSWDRNYVEFFYDMDTLNHYSEEELAISATDYVAPETCTVTVNKVFFDGNQNVPVDMMGTGSYEKNSSITLTAPEAEGVAFVGWYQVYPFPPYYRYTSAPYTWDRQYTFTVTQDLELVAVYRPTDLKTTVTVNCGSKAYTVNGNRYTSRKSLEFGMGASVTVYTDAPGFKYWKNAYGMVLSRSRSYTFTASVDDNIEAVFDSSATDKATLIFESEYGQIMGTAKLALNETMTLPTLPTKNSYETMGWDLNGDGMYQKSTDTLNSAIERGISLADKTVVIKAIYEADPFLNIFITIENGNTTESYSPAPGQLMVAQAGKREGEKFSRWVEQGTGLVLSYNPTYKFYAEKRNGQNLSIIAEFVDDDEEVHKKGVTQIVNSYNNSDNYGLVAVSMSTVPEGCRIIKSGIIAVDSDHYPTENNGWITLDTDGVIVRGDSWPGNAYRYTWTRANAQEERWYVRALLIYEDTSTHDVYTVYGDDVVEMHYSQW